MSSRRYAFWKPWSHTSSGKKVFLKNGLIIYATSNIDTDRLENILLSHKLISREQFDEVPALPLGEFLIEQALQNDDLATAIQLVDRLDAETAPLTSFILPGGAPPAAKLHVCRAVCRRAERAAVRHELQGLDDASTELMMMDRKPPSIRGHS